MIPSHWWTNWRRGDRGWEEAEDDKWNQTPHGESLKGLECRGEVDRPVGSRPDFATALRDERFPSASGERPKETHPMKRAGRGREIVEQMGELRLDEPVDIEDADSTEVLTVEVPTTRASDFTETATSGASGSEFRKPRDHNIPSATAKGTANVARRDHRASWWIIRQAPLLAPRGLLSRGGRSQRTTSAGAATPPGTRRDWEHSARAGMVYH